MLYLFMKTRYLKVLICLILILFFILFNLLRSYFKNKKIIKIGQQGEKDISLILNKLNRKKYYVINDVILKHPNNKTTQIDHIVISRKGIFVIETKNYSGVIYGDLNNKCWTHICGKNKHIVYNIVYQNQGHIKAVKYNINNLLSNITYRKYRKFFVSILSFRDNCDIKINKPFFCNVKFKICKFNNLIKTIKKYNRRNIISKNLFKQLVSEIEKNNINSKRTLKNHIKQQKRAKY